MPAAFHAARDKTPLCDFACEEPLLIAFKDAVSTRECRDAPNRVTLAT
ncbi:hypothetical protein RSSM_01341 [Rhodopirellula sallentina SM41]|uniref:Uncharacterized protein n=1 Tax=Rhodopirellula sallentina SM41 TaxID=1263870 RepID=M5U740_9BACT|nr:hypothetical protein RSSM_01341 [Rhodopirellula sallentina SM41]